MEVGQDARTEQHLILSELREAAAQVKCSAVPSNAEALLTALQLALSDGLRNPDDGFWPAVSMAVHSETRRLVESTTSPRRRGRAWLRMALAESSLGAHLRLLSREPAVRRAYRPGAAFTTRAPQLAALCDSLPDLSLALANKPWDWRGSPVASLPSPGDSGVAMTDSDLEDDRHRGNRGNDVVIAPVVTRRPKRRRCKAKRVSFHDEQTSESMAESTTESTTESMTESTLESASESPIESDCTEALDEQEVRYDPEGQEDPARVDGPMITIEARVDRVKTAKEVRVIGDLRTKEVRVEVTRQPSVVRPFRGPSRLGIVPRPSVFIPAATRDLEGNLELESKIRAVLASAKPTSPVEDRWTGLLDPGESVYKTFRLHWCPFSKEQSSLIGPVLLVVTNHRICVSETTNQVSVGLEHLSAMMVLPWRQGLLLAGDSNDAMLLATGDEQRTNQLAAAVTMATLRATGRFLPVGFVPMATARGNDRLLQDDCKAGLWLVAADDGAGGSSQSPLGPALRGCLMVQSGPGAAWAPRHLALKAGVLYEFETETSPLPLRCHALATLSRCQRTSAGARPHAFMLRWPDSEIRLAAADPEEASHWLDHIVAAANSTEWEGQPEEAGLRWLSLTDQGRLFLQVDAPLGRHGNKPTAQGDVTTLHALRLANEQPHSCQMEWGCQEASQETSGDWLLHFASVSQAQAFVSVVSHQWQKHHKAVLPVTEMESSVVARCQETRMTLDCVWG